MLWDAGRESTTPRSCGHANASMQSPGNARDASPIEADTFALKDAAGKHRDLMATEPRTGLGKPRKPSMSPQTRHQSIGCFAHIVFVARQILRQKAFLLEEPPDERGERGY